MDCRNAMGRNAMCSRNCSKQKQQTLNATLAQCTLCKSCSTDVSHHQTAVNSLSLAFSCTSHNTACTDLCLSCHIIKSVTCHSQNSTKDELRARIKVCFALMLIISCIQIFHRQPTVLAWIRMQKMNIPSDTAAALEVDLSHSHGLI